MAGLDTLINPGFKSDYVASGPIAGVIAAQQMQDWMESQGRAYRNNDLAYASEKNKYEQALLDNPVLAAERQDKLSASGLNQDMYNSGLAREQAMSGAQSKIQQNLSNMTKSQLEQTAARNQWALSASEQLDDEDKNPIAGTRNKDIYENYIYPQAKSVGADKGLTPNYSPAMYQELKRRGAAAVNVAPHIQQMREIYAKNEGQMNIAKEHSSSSLANAQVISGANQANKEALMDPQRKILLDANREADANGGVVSKETLQKVKSVFEEDVWPKAHKATVEDAVKKDVKRLEIMNKEDRTKWLKEKGLAPSMTNSEIEIRLIDKFHDYYEKKWLDKVLPGSTSEGTIKPKPQPSIQKPAASTVNKPTKVGEQKIINGQLMEARPKGEVKTPTSTPSPTRGAMPGSFESYAQNAVNPPPSIPDEVVTDPFMRMTRG